MKPSIQKQVSFLLEQMKKAMPEILRQVEVYENNLKNGKMVKGKAINTSVNNV